MGHLPPRFAGRDIVRILRAVMEPTWLSAIGDKGLVGESVVYATRCIERKVYLGMIVADGWWKVTVSPLKMHWARRDQFGGTVGPDLPDLEELRAMIATGKGHRCRRGDVVICRRPYRDYSFWDGREPYYPGTKETHYDSCTRLESAWNRWQALRAECESFMPG